MKLFRLSFGSSLAVALFLGVSCFAQCKAPEVIGASTEYNKLVCQGIAASERGEYQKALASFLKASKEPIFEYPNLLLFGRIAEMYARLGQFGKSDVYLKYDNLSLLWEIGIVRCLVQSNSNDENLFKDGELLKSAEAKQMVNVLCGEIFDDYEDFHDSDAASFVSAAKGILRYSALRKEIEQMRAKHLPNNK